MFISSLYGVFIYIYIIFWGGDGGQLDALFTFWLNLKIFVQFIKNEYPKNYIIVAEKYI